MKRDAAWFEQREASLIFIARKLKDATQLESLLDEAGVDYGVETDYYTAGIVFRTSRAGAFFYVPEPGREGAVEVLLRNGYVPMPPE